LKSAVFFTTERRHGDARAPGALERLLKARRWPTAVATAEQIHGCRIAVVPALKSAKTYRGVDGLLTRSANQALAIFTADCASLFLADHADTVVGVLHAGWRGARAGILKKAVQVIRRRWGIPARRLRVWLGPSIGPCCFEVRWEVARHFPRSRRRNKGRWTVDLAGELRAQARSLGLQFLRADASASCTMHGGRFYSYRRDKTEKRMASVIMQ